MEEEKKAKSADELIYQSNLSEYLIGVTESQSSISEMLHIADTLHNYQKQERCLLEQLDNAIQLYNGVDHQLALSDVIAIQSSALNIVQEAREDSLLELSSELTQILHTEPDLIVDSANTFDNARQLIDEFISSHSSLLNQRINTEIDTYNRLNIELPSSKILNQIEKNAVLGLANDLTSTLHFHLDPDIGIGPEPQGVDITKHIRDDFLISPSANLSTIIDSQPYLVESSDFSIHINGILDSIHKQTIDTFSSNLPTFEDLQKPSPVIVSAESPALPDLQSAISSTGRLFDLFLKPEDMIGAPTAKLFPDWVEPVNMALSSVESIPLLDSSIQHQISKMSEFSVLAQASLSSLSWNDIGNAIEIENSSRITLQDNFLELSESYSKLVGSWEQEPYSIAELPPAVSTFPPVELFNEANLIGAFTSRNVDFNFVFDHTEHIRREIQYETHDALTEALSRINQDLLEMLLGARHSLKSNHPDSVRHFATSFRELFTHVIHVLAPDDAIISWTSEPSHFHEGRPTRKARLLYICRNVNHGPFTKFIDKDINALLEFTNLFQRGTHRITHDFTHDQLTAMSLRMESGLRFILEVGF